jgi:hypothetical protein
MKKYSYLFLIMDEDGNNITERELTPEQAIDLLVQGPVTAAAPVPIEEARPVEIANKNPTKNPTKGMHKKKKAGGKWEKKPCCGSTGSRHFNTCERGVQSIDEAGTVATDVLSESDFEAVHEEFFVSQQTQKVAATLDLPLQEVNRAMQFRGYATYLQKRLD